MEPRGSLIDVVLGIIGGSGFYDIALDHMEELEMSTPWGSPSSPLYVGEKNGLRIVFLPRHGIGHRIPPHLINYRANIDALKRHGVTDIISVSACGSLKETYAPGDFVFPDQFIDLTHKREKSFFGSGCVGHVSMAYPISPSLQDRIITAARNEKISHHCGGIYVTIEGPQFSTLGESLLYRQWGCDVIGMTNMPEAKLAREAEICYATIAMVTDYDSWHPDHGEVDVREILRVMGENTKRARDLLSHLIEIFPKTRPLCRGGADRSLDYALITPPEHRDRSLMKKLDAVAGRVL